MQANLRRALSSLNLAAMLVLLGVLFIMVNYVSSRRYGRWDLTQQKFAALSEQTHRALATLKEPVSILVFFEPGHPLYEPSLDLLKEYQHVSPKITVETLDPEQDPARAQRLVQELQIDSKNIIVFRIGSRHKHLQETDLAEFNFEAMEFGQQPTLKHFKGEEAFTSTLLNLTQSIQPLVWLTTGHGEKGADDEEASGVSELKRVLGQQNMRVETVDLPTQLSVPENVNLVAILGPTRRLSDQELSLLDKYLKAGGRLLVLIDPLTDTGLETVLDDWGVQLTKDVVVDPARRLPMVSPANLLVMEYRSHAIVENMRALFTMFPLARSVRAVQGAADQLEAVELAVTSEEGWGETKTDVEEFSFQEGEDVRGPVPIAVAVERREVPKTRLVVIGDSDFVSNSQLNNAGNRDLAVGSFHWLLAQEQLIGIAPKKLDSVKLQITEPQARLFFWFSLTGLPVLIGLAGGLMWWTRRR